ncbi:MAG: hypothetical protein RR202_11425 [Bacteroidales bacterium]
MNDLFATVYELWIYNQDYQDIFQTMYDGNDGLFSHYSLIGLLTLFVSLSAAIIFYFLIRYPYTKIWHWLLYAFGIGVFLVGGITYGYLQESLIEFTQDSEMSDITNRIILNYSVYNTVAFLLFFTGLSLVLKRVSKHQYHLPF